MISVIIPTYNAGEYLKEALDSVLAQTVAIREIIVIDDGSTDDTEKIIAPYIETKKIIYVRKAKGSPASARNVGLRLATGKFIAFLDADDFWHPAKSAKQIALFSDPSVGLVYSRRIFWPSGKRAGEILYSGRVTEKLIENNFITTSGVMMLKSLSDQVGFFGEEKRFFTLEDYDFWLRASALSRFAYTDEGLVYYRQHPGQSSTAQPALARNNMIRFYASLFFNRSYKESRGLIAYKLMQNCKGYIMDRIKL